MTLCIINEFDDVTRQIRGRARVRTPRARVNLGLNEYKSVEFTRDRSDTRDHYDLCIIN